MEFLENTDSEEDNIQAENPADEQEPAVLLDPMMVIDVNEILSSWLSEWNETAETSTEQWKLSNFQVQPDGTVTLLFQYEVRQYRHDPDGEIVGDTVETHYRVLVFDPEKKEKTGQYRFHLQGGYAAGVFFRNKELYAVACEDDELDYTALHVWPGCDDDKNFWIGEALSGTCPLDNGDLAFGLILPYLDPPAPGDLPSIAGVAHGKKKRTYCDAFCDMETGAPLNDLYVSELNTCMNGQITAVLSDAETGMVWDRSGRRTIFPLPMKGTVKMAVTDDLGTMYALVRKKEEKFLYVFSLDRNTGNETAAEQMTIADTGKRCAVGTGEGMETVFQECSVSKAVAGLQTGNKIYVVDLNQEGSGPESHVSGR